MKLTLKGRVPSKKNSKRIVVVRGRPLIISSKDYLQWQKDKLIELRVQGIRKIDVVASIEITLFAPDKRGSDLTNKAESIMDLLVDAKILEDDNWFIVPNIMLKFGGVDRLNPRAEINIL